MNRMLQRLHSRTKFVAMCLTIAAFAAVPFTGCGKNDVNLDAPKNAGTAQELSGTSWTEPKSKVTYNFVDESNVDVIDPQLADPIQGTFAVNAGILDLTLGLKTLNGTWDGKSLVVEGKTLDRNE